MPTFTFDDTIPASNNDPSADQPDMLINNQSTNSILAIDHVSFNSVDGGTHKQITFSSENVPGAQGDPQSTLYTDVGIDAPTHPQMFWKNSQGIFPISAIRAFATFTPAVGAIVPGNAFNIVSITKATAASAIVITLTANTTSSNNAVVILTKGTSVLGYTLAGNVITTDTTNVTGRVNLLVLQV